MKTSLLALALSAPLVSPAASTIGFNRDIRPILADACYHCHGPDPASRKEDLRLDRQDGLFGPRDQGPMVVQGRPEQSPLYLRIVSADPDEVMPPPKEHKVLTSAQKDLIRRWIAEGAPWEPHWSLKAPERPAPPAPKEAVGFPIRNPIDAFVLDRLNQEGLSPAPEADRRALARRISLDITGLPPSPEEVEAFVADTTPGYFEAYVDRLLASPRYGEHRARTWLDAARYADTHGLHFDNYREMWPYRDWVIQAFNRNQPFDQFTIEQIAGDLLPNPTRDQKVATGFHRCNVTTNEGGTIPEENLAGYARDRVSTTAWVWLGLTANCAECHDHKFDPITMKDFYSMAAFFRNTTQGALDGNVKDTGPSLRVPLPEDATRFDALPAEIEAAKRTLEERRKVADPAFVSWLAKAGPEDLSQSAPVRGQVVHLPMNEGAGAALRDEVQPGRVFQVNGPLTWLPGGPLGPALQLHNGALVDLGNLGDFEKNQAFSYGAWVKAASATGQGAVLARMDTPQKYRGWDLYQTGGKWSMHLIDAWDANSIKMVTKADTVRPGEWQHVMVTYDGSGKAKGIRIHVDGVEQPLEAANNTLKGKASVRSKVSLKIGRRTDSEPFEGGFVQDVRVFERKLEADEVKALANRGRLKEALALVRAPAREGGANLGAFFAGLPGTGLIVHAPLNEGKGAESRDPAHANRVYKAAGSPEWKEGGPLGDAPLVRKDATFNLGDHGDFEKDQAFSYGIWAKLANDRDHNGILARMDDQKDYRGWDLFQHDNKIAVHFVHKWPEDAMKARTRDAVVKPGVWQHFFVTYDGSAKPEGLRIFVDGVPVALEITDNRLKGSIKTATPLRAGQRSTGQLLAGAQLQDARLYNRRLDEPEVRQLAAARPPAELLVSQARVDRAREDLREHYLAAVDAPTGQARQRLESLQDELADIQERSPVTHIQQERMNSAPMAKILRRGQYDQPVADVEAATFAALPPMPAGAPRNRLGLAQWLVMRENPLTARVNVNRLWQDIFGAGIVKTAEDFGIVGEKPSHPELLDWLAVEFQDSGWNVKHMVRLILTSSAYRQSVAVTPQKLEKDPQNRLLSRGPRFRMDAEMVRDGALAVSGLLSPRIGGASARPYQPDGVWEAVAMPESDTKRYQRDEGENLYRRSLYTFWKRSAPPASMDIFNAPSRETCAVRRERTNTPLQALVTLNDPQFVEAARKLAESALKASNSAPEATLDHMARRCLARAFRSEERAVLLGTLKDMQAYYHAHPAEAKALLGVGDAPADPGLDSSSLAAWTLAAGQILNLDENLNK